MSGRIDIDELSWPRLVQETRVSVREHKQAGDGCIRCSYQRYDISWLRMVVWHCRRFPRRCLGNLPASVWRIFLRIA